MNRISIININLQHVLAISTSSGTYCLNKACTHKALFTIRFIFSVLGDQLIDHYFRDLTVQNDLTINNRGRTDGYYKIADCH